MNEINKIFQEYLIANYDHEPIDFASLLQSHPELKEQLEKKIKAYQTATGIFHDDQHDTKTISLVGKTLGGCKLIKIIGQGGMGVVYLADQESLGRNVVVKVLRPFAVDNQSLKERFLRESRIVGKLNHRGIVPVYDVGNEDGSFYIVMKHVEGIALSDLIRRISKTDRSLLKIEDVQATLSDTSLANYDLKQFKSPTEFFCGLIIKVADALQYAHSNGVIHRDIKPSNILIEPDGNPVLLDFGLSHDEVEQNLTLSGEFLGTPIYSAPELFKKSSGKDARLFDVYSLGVTLYELLTGGLPYDGSSIYDICASIKGKEPTRPKARWKGIPRDLETIVTTAISKEPKLRYSSVEVFKEDLLRFVTYQPIYAKAPTSVKRVICFAKRKRKALLITSGFLCLLISVTILAITEYRPTLTTFLMHDAGNDLINRNVDRAERKLRVAHLLNPHNPDVCKYYASVLFVSGKHEQALAEVNRVLSYLPDEPVLLGLKSQILSKQGKDKESSDVENKLLLILENRLNDEPTSLNDVDKNVLFQLYRSNGEEIKAGKLLSILRNTGFGEYKDRMRGVEFKTPFQFVRNAGAYDAEVLQFVLPSSEKYDPFERVFPPMLSYVVLDDINIKNQNDLLRAYRSIAKTAYSGRIKNWKQLRRPVGYPANHSWIELQMVLGKYTLTIWQHSIFKDGRTYILMAMALPDRFTELEPDFNIALSSFRIQE